MTKYTLLSTKVSMTKKYDGDNMGLTKYPLNLRSKEASQIWI